MRLLLGQWNLAKLRCIYLDVLCMTLNLTINYFLKFIIFSKLAITKKEIKLKITPKTRKQYIHVW